MLDARDADAGAHEVQQMPMIWSRKQPAEQKHRLAAQFLRDRCSCG